ncbi:MAG: metal-binding protein [Lachnospiraceae bacterium]|nr:metal-binding protein [Candidatus Equihabitans merdae]
MLYVSNQKTTEDGDRFFSNRSCPYFPCLKGVKEEEFNCLFCYCPLYVLGKDCGGRFVYNSKGRKVCTDCPIPHIKKNHDYVVSRYNEIVERMDRLDKKQ